MTSEAFAPGRRSIRGTLRSSRASTSAACSESPENSESLRLAGRRASVRLQWREVPEHHGAVASRALALDLSGLSPGPYRIELVVHGPAAARASAIREITVRVR